MVVEIATLVFVGALVGFALLKLDDTNFQIVVLPGIVLMVWLVPEVSGTAGALGIAAGTLAYLAIFIRARGQKVSMPDYSGSRDSNEHSSAPLRLGYLGTQSSEPESTPLVPDGPYYIPNTPEKIRIAASGTSGEAHALSGEGARDRWHTNRGRHR